MSSTYTDKQVDYIVNQRESTDKTWEEIGEKFNKKFSCNKTINALRKTYRRYSGYDISQDTIVGNLKSVSRLRKSNSKIKKENELIVNDLIAKEDFLNEFENILSRTKFKLHKKAIFKKKKKTKRTIIAHLSDIHIEANIEADEMGNLNKYGRVEQARRLAFFFKQVAEYKKNHRKDTDLKLVINGDILQGVINSIEGTSPITTQVSAAIHLLTQGITYLSCSFNSIEILYTCGNHSRMQHNKDKSRATERKWDSFATMVGLGIKYFIKSYRNISIRMDIPPYIYTKIQGHDFFITHGDTVLSAGNIGKSISTEKLKNKLNDLSTALGNIDVFLAAHVHVPAYSRLNNGIKMLVNGSVSGVDPFCQSIGILNNSAVQQIFEVTKEHSVGDVRFVDLLPADDMKELDKIIEPFKGKF